MIVSIRHGGTDLTRRNARDLILSSRELFVSGLKKNYRCISVLKLSSSRIVGGGMFGTLTDVDDDGFDDVTITKLL